MPCFVLFLAHKCNGAELYLHDSINNNNTTAVNQLYVNSKYHSNNRIILC